MKYLDEPRLAYWSNFLGSVELGDRLLSVRADAFSCEAHHTILARFEELPKLAQHVPYAGPQTAWCCERHSPPLSLGTEMR